MSLFLRKVIIILIQYAQVTGPVLCTFGLLFTYSQYRITGGIFILLGILFAILKLLLKDMRM